MRHQPINEALDRCLSTEAFYKGYRLTWWAPEVFAVDPVILYMNFQEVYRWQYIPSMSEVWDKIRELEIQH